MRFAHADGVRETGNEQHAAQITTLQRQVEHFAGQVTRWTADYRTLAESGPSR